MINIYKKALIIGVIIIFRLTQTLLMAQSSTCANWLRFQLKTDSFTPLKDAEVFIEELHFIKKTDANGEVTWTELCHTNYEIEVWYQGKHQHYVVNTNQFYVFLWQPTDTVRISEMHIKHYQQKNQTELLQISSLSIPTSLNISEKMAEMPMIRLQKTGNSIQKPMLQGLSGLRLPLFQDGMRLQGQGWGNDHAPELGRWGVQEISIKKGAEALKYAADGWGNLLEISYRPSFHAFENHAEFLTAFESNARTLQSGFRYSQGGKKELDGFYVSAQYQNAGDYAIPGTYLPNTSYTESSLYCGLSYGSKKAIHQLDFAYFYFKGGIYLGSHIGNITDLKWAISQSNPVITSENFERQIHKPYQTAENIRLSYERIPINRSGIVYRIGYQFNQRQEFDPHRNSTLQFPQLNLWIHNIQTSALKKWEINGLTLQTGAQYEVKIQDWGGYFLAPKYSGNDLAFFAHLPWVISKFRHQFTVRYDQNWRFTELKEQIISESFGGFSMAYTVHWNTPKIQNEIHITWSRRAPSVNERFSAGVHHGSASYEQGKWDLGMEQGLKFDWQRQAQINKFQYRSNFYGIYASNFIHLNPQKDPILSIRGAFPYYIYEGLPTIYFGLNLWGRYHVRDHIFEAQFDLLWGKLIEQHRFPTQMPPPSFKFEWHKEIKEVKVIFRQTFTTKMPFYTTNTDLSPPPDAYYLSDLFCRFNHLFQINDLKLESGIRNIFNETYREYLDRFRYFTPQMGRNIYIQLVWNIHHHREHKIHDYDKK